MQPLVFDFADGQYPFKLTVEGVLELQEKCKAGFGEIYGRVVQGVYLMEGQQNFFAVESKFHVNDILETIRLGLIGGGCEPRKALDLRRRYCYPEQSMKETWALAAAVIMASMDGFEIKSPAVEEKKEEQANDGAVKKKRSRTRKAGSTRVASSPTSEQ